MENTAGSTTRQLSGNQLSKQFELRKILESIEKSSRSCHDGILEEMLQMFPKYIEQDGAAIFGCLISLTCLQEQQKLPCFNESQFAKLWQWLLDVYTCRDNTADDVCRILIAMGNLFALHPGICEKYFVAALQLLIKNISFKIPDMLLVTTLQCLNKILCSFKDANLSEEQLVVCGEVGCELLQLHYGKVQPKADSLNISDIILSSFQVFQRIVTLNPIFAKERTAELLGLSKTYFHYGLEAREASLLKPEKVNISQQALYDSAEEIETVMNSEKVKTCGGKTPKTRKPRTVVKNARANDHKVANRSAENGSILLTFDLKTSDSEISEPENATNRVLFERSRKAKIRLAAISLVGSIARTLERKAMFGYWHALFPSETAHSSDNLLYLGQHDPNLRCRSAALQVSANLIYGSKGYLHQAEIDVKSCPSTFVPFSVSLGYTVLAIYRSLTAILSAESALPVLTQALKCLAVLVQASPFKQFEKGLVKSFVKVVKPLIYHRDAAVQVSALMVMEFLLALPEITGEIAEAIGVPQEAVRFLNKAVTNTGLGEMDTVDIEEFVESEEEEEKDNNEKISAEDIAAKQAVSKEEEICWLLKRVLLNLGQPDKIVTTSVRIESLQVLIVMSAHFALIKPHLGKVAEVLLLNLNHSLPDVRLYAARCVDACAYQISRYLLEKALLTDLQIKECHKFWVVMMPIILSRIRRDAAEMSALRITLCDALSNMGVLMFEQTTHSSQIGLLSFLSGVSSDTTEDTLVRAAGARALAVFALYPSLRGDLVFIENTAELTLHLVKDSNLMVRVKSFWSLGNISDALIASATEATQVRCERLSDDLLFRLVCAATEACSDNDKVRCNAVRTLGNLLRLLSEEHFNSVKNKTKWLQAFEKSILKLSDCLRASGNAKVKWNTCYAITNIMRNPTVFKVQELRWQETLFTALCHVIVHHSNFKVRINASAAITNIMQRCHFGVYFEKFWAAVLEAIEQSYNLDSFHEYNHRDSLQEQLCLALAHILKLSQNDDLAALKKLLMPRAEIIHNTWQRVVNRMVPEKAAPLIACPILLKERTKNLESLTSEHKKYIEFLIEIFSIE